MLPGRMPGGCLSVTVKQNWQRGHAYRLRTDANYRARQQHSSTIKKARRRLIHDNPNAACQSRAKTPCGGGLELHHVGGDLTGAKGYRVFCRAHNRRASGQDPNRLRHPGGA